MMHLSSGQTDDDTGPPVAALDREELRFDDFYAVHFERLAVQLYAYTGDVGQAQDVVQEAFCRALTRWKTVAQFDDPVAWIRRVAWNLATSRFRRLRVARAPADRQRPVHVEGPSPDRVALVRALAALPDRQRRAVVLFHLADLSIVDRRGGQSHRYVGIGLAGAGTDRQRSQRLHVQQAGRTERQGIRLSPVLPPVRLRRRRVPELHLLDHLARGE